MLCAAVKREKLKFRGVRIKMTFGVPSLFFDRSKCIGESLNTVVNKISRLEWENVSRGRSKRAKTRNAAQNTLQGGFQASTSTYRTEPLRFRGAVAVALAGEVDSGAGPLRRAIFSS